jgi:phage terminase large subunit
MTADDVEEARRSMSEAEFRQEYEADFSIFEGKIWNLKQHCIGNIPEDLDLRKCDVFAGLDLGFRDPTAMVVAAYSWDHEKFFLLDEYRDNERVTSGHAEEIKKLMDKRAIDYIYIDSANQQQRFDFAQEYDIPTTNAKKSVLDGIGYVASLIDTDRVFVDSSLSHVLHALDQYQWDDNQNLQKEKPKHNEASHMADALRYALYSYKTSAGGF